MIWQKRIAVWDLVGALANTMDLATPSAARRHEQICYVALRIGREMGLDEARLRNLVLAAALLDCGALCSPDKLQRIEPAAAGLSAHAYAGCRFLRTFRYFRVAAEAVLFHHLPWRHGAGQEFRGEAVPPEAHLLQLADRTVTLAAETPDLLVDRDRLLERLRQAAGETFVPETVDALCRLAQPEAFWLDLTTGSPQPLLRDSLDLGSIPLTDDAMLDMSSLFARIVDFRSPFWATHTAGVAKAARLLAGKAGMCEDECRMVTVAANLHDVGGVAVAPALLEKREPLSPQDKARLRAHVYHTYRCLQPIDGLGPARDWASFHHERLDGTGYPFGLHARSLPLGARILAVVDTYTACTEDRPYRPRMGRQEALKALNQNAADAALDGDLVALLTRNIEIIDGERLLAQQAARSEYDGFFGACQAES